LRESAYVIVNQTKQLVPYTQAILLRGYEGNHLKAYALSNVSEVDHTSPFVHWIERVAEHVSSLENADLIQTIDSSSLPQSIAENWDQLCPANMLWVPLSAGWRGRQGVLILSRDIKFSDQDGKNLAHLSKIFGFALAADPNQFWLNKFKNVFRSRMKKILVVLLLLGMFPVRLTAISPTEIIPRSPHVVSAPFDAVVANLEVYPNQNIAKGDVLVKLEGEDYFATQEIRKRAVQVAEANLHRAVQAGFEDPQSRSEVASLKAELDLKKMELVQAELKNKNTIIIAEKSGVAVVEDPVAWQGRPVKIGERILQIANPDEVEVQIYVLVKDAIALEPGRSVKVFLDTDPLSPIDAKIQYAAYEPIRTEEDIPAYRVVAKISENQVVPRIGLRGTAKNEGDYVALVFYLFRRPITAVRQWIGW